MLALLCPGQGAQTGGFLAPWLALPGVAERVATWSEPAGLDLTRVGSLPDEDVVDTAVAQPLLVAAALAGAAEIGELPADSVVVGHSIGELAAAALAGAVPARDAVALARIRGAAMAAACADADGGMTAVLGGDEAEVLAAIDRAGCVAANVNGAGQVVAAGPHDALARLAADPPARTRVRPLGVAGPFHSPWMAPARDSFDAAVDPATFAAHHRRVVSDLDGAVITTGPELARRLVAQVTAPVRFDECLRTLRTLGVTAAVELTPGGVLAGLVRRELPDVDVVALRSPDDLDAARALVREHLPDGERVHAEWRLVGAE